MKHRASLGPIKKNQRLTLFLRYKNQRSVKITRRKNSRNNDAFYPFVIEFCIKGI